MSAAGWRATSCRQSQFPSPTSELTQALRLCEILVFSAYTSQTWRSSGQWRAWVQEPATPKLTPKQLQQQRAQQRRLKHYQEVRQQRLAAEACAADAAASKPAATAVASKAAAAASKATAAPAAMAAAAETAASKPSVAKKPKVPAAELLCTLCTQRACSFV